GIRRLRGQDGLGGRARLRGPGSRAVAGRRAGGPGGGPVMEWVVFAAFALTALVASVGVVLSRSPVHSALYLVLTLFCVAVFFVMQGADFLAAVQVIVYAGAIVVLFLFVIML